MRDGIMSPYDELSTRQSTNFRIFSRLPLDQRASTGGQARHQEGVWFLSYDMACTMRFACISA